MKVISDSNHETNFPHKLILIDRKVSRILQALVNGSSANIKFSKSRLSKIVHLRVVIRNITVLAVFYGI